MSTTYRFEDTELSFGDVVSAVQDGELLPAVKLFDHRGKVLTVVDVTGREYLLIHEENDRPYPTRYGANNVETIIAGLEDRFGHILCEHDDDFWEPGDLPPE